VVPLALIHKFLVGRIKQTKKFMRSFEPKFSDFYAKRLFLLSNEKMGTGKARSFWIILSFSNKEIVGTRFGHGQEPTPQNERF